MRKSALTLCGFSGVVAVLAMASLGARPAPAGMRPVSAHSSAAIAGRVVIEQYCLQCHDEDKKKGELSLEAFDPAKADSNPEVAEKMVRKLRAGMMPPSGADRPAEDALEGLAAMLETKLDALVKEAQA